MCWLVCCVCVGGGGWVGEKGEVGASWGNGLDAPLPYTTVECFHSPISPYDHLIPPFPRNTIHTASPSHAAAAALVQYFPEQDGVLAESLLLQVGNLRMFM